MSKKPSSTPATTARPGGAYKPTPLKIPGMTAPTPKPRPGTAAPAPAPKATGLSVWKPPPKPAPEPEAPTQTVPPPVPTIVATTGVRPGAHNVQGRTTSTTTNVTASRNGSAPSTRAIPPISQAVPQAIATPTTPSSSSSGVVAFPDGPNSMKEDGSLLCFQIEHNVLFNLRKAKDQLRALKDCEEIGVDLHYQKEVRLQVQYIIGLSSNFLSVSLSFLYLDFFV